MDDNIAQSVHPVYGIHQQTSSSPTRQWCVEGEEERAYLIGLTLYAMICRKELRYAFAVGRGRDSYAPSGIRFNPASKDTPANPSLFINGP